MRGGLFICMLQCMTLFWGTKQTSGHVHLLVANGRKADIALASAKV